MFVPEHACSKELRAAYQQKLFAPIWELQGIELGILMHSAKLKLRDRRPDLLAVSEVLCVALSRKVQVPATVKREKEKPQ